MSLRSTVRWLGGVLIVLLSLLFALHKNAEIQTDIWIERPTAAVWQIRKITFDINNNPTDIKFASGSPSFGAIWNNRASLSYS